MNRTRPILTFCTGLVLCVLLWIPTAQADEMYLWVKGEKQGQIKGGVTKKGLENFIEIERMSYEVSARDAASGLPSGKRQHKPFTITKPVDKSSPLFFRALVMNENLPEFFLDTWMPQTKGAAGPAGIMVKVQTVKLINANAVNYRRFTEPDGRGGVQTLEEISFVFQAIEIMHHDGGIMAGDSLMGK